MSNVVSAVNITATVLGYILLLLLLAGALLVVGVRYDEWRYTRHRRRQNDIEWDNLRSAWIFRQREEEAAYDADRVNTDILEFTVEQIYTYQKEHGR